MQTESSTVDSLPTPQTVTQPVGILGWTTGTSGVHFHRIQEPVRVIAESGYTAFCTDRLDDEALSRVDTVLASGLHYEQDTEAWHALAKLDRHRLVLDVDDWYWDPDIQVLKDAWTPDELRRLESNIERAHIVTTPSYLIANQLAKWNDNVWIVPNTVPAYVLDIPRPPAEQGLWLGYQGALDRSHDWRPQVVGVAKFLRDHPEWGIGFIGEMNLGDFANYRAWRKPWTDNRPDYYRAVSAFTVGLGPLRKTMFNLAKSSLRAIEYMALGVVPVLPDLEPYRYVIKGGLNGMLIRPADTTRGILTDLAREPLHIARMSAQARADATRFTTENAIEAWAEAWNSR